jgi:hypothetical protein
MTSDLDQFKCGIAAGWCRLSSSEQITAGLSLFEYLDDAIGHTGTPQTRGALDAYIRHIDKLSAYAVKLRRQSAA